MSWYIVIIKEIITYRCRYCDSVKNGHLKVGSSIGAKIFARAGAKKERKK